MKRATDSNEVSAFRTDRYFVSNGFWFFATREAQDFGPYRDRPEAARAVKRYVETQLTMARLRRQNTVRDPDAVFNTDGVARMARDIKGWSEREVGTIRGDDRVIDD